MNPQVSVILPYYEGQEWVLQAVQSVQAQKGVSWELIIIDDGSKKSIETEVNSLDDNRVRLHIKNHAGKGAALNRGVWNARTDIVCFIDQDDIMLPERLKNQFYALSRHPEADGVYSDYERGLNDGDLIDQFVSDHATTQKCLHQIATGHSPISMQTLMLRKEIFVKIGGFSENPNLTGLDDLDFFVRLLISGANLKYKRGFVQRWIQHEKNYSKGFKFQEARLNLLKHLTTLAENDRNLKKEMRHFCFHAYYMRGLYFLENSSANKATYEFCKAIQSMPLNWNIYYLFLKSLLIQFQRYLIHHE